MPGNRPLSITARAKGEVTHYERGRGWSFTTVSGDQEKFIIGDSGSELRSSE